MKKISEFLIRLTSKFVGSDEFGNRYFQSKNDKRFVIYNGIAEASKIPAEWHGWIHHSYNDIPSNLKRYSWQKIHMPNLTGTMNAYSPKNSSSSKTRAIYSSWNPNPDNN